jgi:TolB-like protein/Flp pilus assembly protein TadD
MSPEQAQGNKVDHRTDIWSLGVVMYEMITGQRPFKSEYETALMYSIINEDPEPVTGLRSGVPIILENIILKCLKKDPQNRYQHADDIIVDLRRVANELSSGVRTMTPSTRNANKVISPDEQSNIQRIKPLLYGISILLIVVIAGYLYFNFSGQTITTGEIRSIAILPLANLSGDPEQEYFADGMTEALIAELAQIKDLRVISRTSVMPYKGIQKSLPQIGSELKVEGIIEGSVFRSLDRVRITVQLIEVSLDRHLWAKSYERNLTDILRLQRDVARDIAVEIKVVLTPDVEIRLAAERTVTPRAHEAFLRGQHYMRQVEDLYSEDVVRNAIQYFEQAISIEPDWSMAYSHLASAYHWLASGGIEPSKYYSKAKEAALTAIKLDENNSKAHASLAFVFHRYEWDWDAAEREYKRALELDPNSHNWIYALFLLSAGRHNEAIENYRRAQGTHPVSVQLRAQLGWASMCAGIYDQAIEQLQNAIELAPHNASLYFELAYAYVRKSMFEEANFTAEKAFSLSERSPWSLIKLGRIYALAGRQEEVQDVINQVEDIVDHTLIIDIAELYTFIDRKEAALRLLEEAYENRSDYLLYIQCSAIPERLQDEQRFQRIMDGINFPN